MISETKRKVGASSKRVINVKEDEELEGRKKEVAKGSAKGCITVQLGDGIAAQTSEMPVEEGYVAIEDVEGAGEEIAREEIIDEDAKNENVLVEGVEQKGGPEAAGEGSLKGTAKEGVKSEEANFEAAEPSKIEDAAEQTEEGRAAPAPIGYGQDTLAVNTNEGREELHGATGGQRGEELVSVKPRGSNSGIAPVSEDGV